MTERIQTEISDYSTTLPFKSGLNMNDSRKEGIHEMGEY